MQKINTFAKDEGVAEIMDVTHMRVGFNKFKRAPWGITILPLDASRHDSQ